MKRTRFALLLTGAFVTGCSAHSPMIVTDTTDVSRAAPVAGGHGGGIYLTPDAFPPGLVRVVGKIDAGTAWYGDEEEALMLVAEKARELGAHAVMQVETWHQPSGFAWAAPHASGIAVVFTQPVALNPARGKVL